MLQISHLYIYPIKSLSGIEVNEALITEKGFEHDRRWMLVDENNRFISQRELAGMTQLQPAITNEGLLVTHKTKLDSIVIPFKSPGQNRVMVTIWDDRCMAEFVSDEADAWFTSALGVNCRLVYMPDESKRIVDPNYALQNELTSFADAYPFLMIGQTSLNDLNNRLIETIPINRFRPNIVFTGGTPYQEDSMASVSIRGIIFSGVKLCARCVMITIDQDKGTGGKEPSKTLATYRQKNKKLYFGQNMLCKGGGIIKVGDELKVLSIHQDERFVINPANEIFET
jgi:uncharacterized protein YcbX